jgi:hypothetical protein
MERRPRLLAPGLGKIEVILVGLVHNSDNWLKKAQS